MKLWGPVQFKSVGMKMFVIIFGAIVLLSVVLGLSSYLMSKQIIRGQVGLASSQAIEQAADKLDFLFAQYESISRQLAVDQTLKSDLEIVNRKEIDTVTKTQAEGRINKKLESLRAADDRLLGVRLVSKSLEETKSYKSTGVSSIRSDEVVEGRVKQVLEAAGNPIWLPSFKQGFFDAYAEPTVTMGRLLRNMKDPDAEYILLIEIKEKALGTLLSNLKIGNSGEVRILTADNRIVHSPNSELLESKSFIGLDDNVLNSEQSSFSRNDEQGVKQLVVFQPLHVANWRIIGYAPESDFLSAADKLIYVMLSVLLLAIIVALLIGYYLIRMIGKPMEKLCRLMEEGERGNLKVRAHFKGRDEIGRLGHSFNKMLEQISLLVDQTNHSTQELLTTAENLAKVSKNTSQTAGEISVATGEIANGAASLANEAERGSELVEDIGCQMNKVVEMNEMMNQSVERVIEVSRQGKEYMEQLVGKTEAVTRMTGLIEENSVKLNKSTYSIRSILAPMVEMTKQTNILSLNASIEASRAGTAGKGFMVIAEEIRQLAVQSNNSIQTVSAITEEIQEAIQHTVNVLLSISPMFAEQLGSVKEVSAIFQNVTEEMEHFVGDIQSSSTSVHELMASQVSLGEFIMNVSSVVEQSNASTQEVASMSSDQYKVSEELVTLSNRLEELAESLNQSLTSFHVNQAVNVLLKSSDHVEENVPA